MQSTFTKANSLPHNKHIIALFIVLQHGLKKHDLLKSNKKLSFI